MPLFGLLVLKKNKTHPRYPPSGFLWLPFLEFQMKLCFLICIFYYRIKLNLIKICYFPWKRWVFNATYSVFFISFHSISFRKIPIAVYKAKVNRSSKPANVQYFGFKSSCLWWSLYYKNDNTYLYHRIALPNKMKGNDQELVQSISVSHSQHQTGTGY